jgi:hypothetical protein
MPPKRDIKAELDRIEKEYDAEQQRLHAEQAAADKKKERVLNAKAALTVEGIPDRVSAMIGAFGSIALCSGTDDGVGRTKDECSGLAAKIIALLELEGLGDRVFVDIDMSGSWSAKDSLRFKTRK